MCDINNNKLESNTTDSNDNKRKENKKKVVFHLNELSEFESMEVDVDVIEEELNDMNKKRINDKIVCKAEPQKRDKKSESDAKGKYKVLDTIKDLDYMYQYLDDKYFSRNFLKNGVRVKWSNRMSKNLIQTYRTKDAKQMEIRLSQKLLQSSPPIVVLDALRTEMHKSYKLLYEA